MIRYKAQITLFNQGVIEYATDQFQEAASYRYSNPDKYVQILNDLYATETKRRVLNLQAILSEPKYQKTVLSHISRRENIIDFMVDWCWTYDPRNANIGLPATIPWIPWKKQIEFIEWIYNLYLNQKSGIVDKARDQGVTWLFCLILIQEWRWVQGFAGGIGSNKLENVHKRDDPDSIFEKIGDLLRRLPEFWFPKGWNPLKHDKISNLKNPEQNTTLSGQGGKDIGRGGRRSFYWVDEFASLEFPKMADASLSANTDSNFALSTPKGMNYFGQKRHSNKLPVFSFDWRSDPRKNDEWARIRQKELDPVVWAQEYGLDYQASVDGLFIEPKWIRAAIELKLDSEGIRSGGLDVAAGGKNKSALCLREGPYAKVKNYNLENGSDLVHETFQECNEAGVQYLNYDVIGVGHAVQSVAERTEFPINFPHFAIRAGDEPSDRVYPEFRDRTGKEMFFNSRAEMWYIVAQRFKRAYEFKYHKKHFEHEDMISIENDMELVSQLSYPMKFTTEKGKIKCESKEQMLKRGLKSPDDADALILAFSPQDAGNISVVTGYNNASKCFREINIREKPSSQRQLAFASLSMLETLQIQGICAVWNEVEGVLYIHEEIVFQMPTAQNLAQVLCQKLNMRKLEVEKVMGNDIMFKDEARSFMKECNNALDKLVGDVQSVKMKPPRRYDPIGSLSIINALIEKEKLVIDTSCRELHRQMSNWRLEKGKLKQTGMREAILMLCSELKQHVPIEEILKKMEYVSHLRYPEKKVKSNVLQL